MREFQKWAKARGIAFKRQREERSAFEVWRACQSDANSKDLQISDLIDELNAVGSLLADMQEINRSVIAKKHGPDFRGIVEIINPLSYGENK